MLINCIMTPPHLFQSALMKNKFHLAEFFMYSFLANSFFSEPPYKIITDTKNKMAFFHLTNKPTQIFSAPNI